MLNNGEFLQCGHFLTVWGDQFFSPALAWLEGGVDEEVVEYDEDGEWRSTEKACDGQGMARLAVHARIDASSQPLVSHLTYPHTHVCRL